MQLLWLAGMWAICIGAFRFLPIVLIGWSGAEQNVARSMDFFFD
jgi:hypothetical protein